MKLSRLIFVVLSVCLSLQANGQFSGGITSASTVSLGGISTVNMNRDNGFNHISLIASLHERLGVINIQNLYGMSSLSSSSIGLSLYQGERATLFAQYHFSGTQYYNEQKIGLGYAKAILKNLFIGIQLDYLRNGIKYLDYTSSNYLTFEIASTYLVNEDIVLGFNIFNPLAIKRYNYQNETIPAVYRVGVSYRGIQKLNLLFEIEKSTFFSPFFRLGAELVFFHSLFLRAGTLFNKVFITSFGIGIENKKWTLSIGGQLHPTLGLSSAITAGIMF